MERQRNISWEKYGISKYRYRELKFFCLQYKEKKEKIRRGLTRGAAVQTTSTGNSKVESQAINNVRYAADVEAIEECCKEAHKDLAPYILQSVTEDITYEAIISQKRIPYGKTDFYAARRYFYYLLDMRLKKVGTN